MWYETLKWTRWDCFRWVDSASNSTAKPKSAAETFDIRFNDTIDDRVATYLAEVFYARSNTIEKFHAVHCKNVGSNGWMSLAPAFRSLMPALNIFEIRHSHLNDDLVIPMIEGLFNKPPLMHLDMIGQSIQNHDDA